MLVALESYVFDPLGAILIDANPTSALDTSTRRISRTATLDGNAAITDNGYTAADSTLSIHAYLSRADEATVLRLMRLYPEVVCSHAGGCLLGVVDDYRRGSSGEAVIQFTVQRSLTE